MKVYFHGGPKNGQFEEIPDGRDRWDVYVGPSLSTCFSSSISGDAPPPITTPRVVTYVPCNDLATYTRLGLAQETIGDFGLSVTFSPVVVFVPSNSVKSDGTPANHRWN